ncbi:MAG: hypothetical protein HN542_00355 [Flavobacteriales bacterium]|nr:hypothetical protein [Flavobacteriales bacterium]MBT3963355.1 hypothetical protein [Flavobacteriales bacterium]MBT4704479.1 hypothetical protein [Flavobacteriales bacterium]MBT4931234.1 hypothetical protein [Flavobacteriales bacterium]MBT5131989.1 hypothetical protein [Flavobacteriales bacterium]
MKNILILKASTLLLVFPSFAGTNLSKAIIEFTHGGSRLTQSVIHQVDQVYDKLPINFEVELVLVSNYERQRDYPTACRLSLNRCRAIFEHLRTRGVEVHRFKVKQYERRRYVRDLSYDNAIVSDRMLVNNLIVSRQPDMPLQFTHSGINPLLEGGESFTIDNTEVAEIYDSKGVLVRFPQYAFQSESGILGECDFVDIELHSYLSKEEFLLNELTSNSGEKMLESAGMLYISATCSGEPIELRRGKLIEIFIPAYDLKREMKVFQGEDEFDIINWERMSWSNVQLQQEDEWEEDEWEDEEWSEFDLLDGSWFEGDGYLLESSALGWINCDLFYEIDNPTNLMVDVPDFNNEIGVRMIFDTINSILPAQIIDATGLLGFNEIPSNEEVWIVAYGKVNNKYVYAEHQMTTGNLQRIQLEPEVVDKATIHANLTKF